MCKSESCLGYLFLFVILGFLILIIFLLKTRKNLLKNDLKLTGSQIWAVFCSNFSQHLFSQTDLIFSIWQDKTSTKPCLIFKNYNNEVLGQVDFQLGSREYKLFIADQVYKIVYNLTWGGSSVTLFSPDGIEMARFERTSFNVIKHKFIIPDLGSLTSKQSVFNLKKPTEYSLNEKTMALTQLISATRQVGRSGCFSNDITLPVKFFILTMTS